MTLAEQGRDPSVENDGIDEEDIVERIFEAVIEQRLPPGTKLSESALCEAFGVGRMRIRRSLLLLASREVVVLQANRGAFVASPTAEQAREVFEARLMIEPNVARLAAERAGAAEVAMLAAHLALEETAHTQNRRRDAIRLSGQFHVLLAQVAGNTVALRMVKELATRTSLIIGLFGSPGVSNCRDEDHGAILAALRKRDGALAADLMTGHLEHIQENLNLAGRSDEPADLASIFRRR